MVGQAGVTMMEMLVVVALIGLLAGISYPTASAGLDNIRLASATEQVAAFLNAAVTRAERRQEPVELEISLAKGRMRALAADGSDRHFRTPDGISLEAVLPELTGATAPKRATGVCLDARGDGSGDRRGVGESSRRLSNRAPGSHDRLSPCGKRRKEVDDAAKPERGFTLLEVLVATVIMGIAVRR